MTTARPILTADILSRQAVRSLRIVSLQDFRTGEWAENATADLSAFVPYCLDIRDRRSCYVKAGGVKSLLRAKFQYLHLRERATRIASIPWERGRLLETPAPEAVFLFSVGRCGSTLLVEALRDAGVVALSEPDFYTQAVAGYLNERGVDRGSALSRAIRALTDDLLCLCGQESRQPGVIKLRAECCRAPAFMLRAQGERPPTLFLIRDFSSWAASMLRTTVLSPQRIVGRYLEGLRCLHWLFGHSHCHLLTYENLVSDPQSSIGAAAGALSLTLDSQRLKVAFKRDAQLGTPLARRAVRERPVDPQRLAATLGAWADAKPVGLLKEVGLARLC